MISLIEIEMGKQQDQSKIMTPAETQKIIQRQLKQMKQKLTKQIKPVEVKK